MPDDDPPRRGPDVDPVVRIAEMAVHRVVLFEPAVHRSEVDGNEIVQRQPAVRAGEIGVGGDRSSGDSASDSHVPPGGASLGRLGGTEQIRIEVVNGVVVLRRRPVSCSTTPRRLSSTVAPPRIARIRRGHGSQ